MKILHLADIHIDAHRKTAGQVRLAPDGRPWGIAATDAACRALVKRAGAVDLYLIAGDLFDRATPTGAEERAAIDLVADLADLAPVVVVAGNHDIPNTSGSTALECLRRRPRIYVVERPQMLAFAVSGGGACLVSGEPGDRVDVALACVPYPRRAELARGGQTRTQEERNAVASEALRQVIAALKVKAAQCGDPLTRRVLCYHGSIGGAAIRDQPRSLAGDIVIDVPDLAGWDYVACGHIHQQQEIAPGIWYSGSPERCGFGEQGEPKGAIVVGFKQQKCTITPVVNEAATEHVTLSPSGVAAAELEHGIAYRLKGIVAPDEALELRRQIAHWQEGGAWVVDALEVQREVRVRDSLAHAQESSAELLRRWLDGRGEVETIAEQFTTPAGDVVDEVCDLHRSVEDGSCDH